MLSSIACGVVSANIMHSQVDMHVNRMIKGLACFQKKLNQPVAKVVVSNLCFVLFRDTRLWTTLPRDPNSFACVTSVIWHLVYW